MPYLVGTPLAFLQRPALQILIAGRAKLVLSSASSRFASEYSRNGHGMLDTIVAVTAVFLVGMVRGDRNYWLQPLNAKSAAYDEPCTIDCDHCDGSVAQHL